MAQLAPAGMVTTATQAQFVHLLATLLNHPYVLIHQMLCVTWAGLAPAGMEIIACLQDLFVHLHATPLLQRSAGIPRMLCVTMEWMLMVAGWETTAGQLGTSVLCPVSLTSGLTAQALKLCVRWAGLATAGMETTACLKAPIVQ